jgi:hypothetical protein
MVCPHLFSKEGKARQRRSLNLRTPNSNVELIESRQQSSRNKRGKSKKYGALSEVFNATLALSNFLNPKIHPS